MNIERLLQKIFSLKNYKNKENVTKTLRITLEQICASAGVKEVRGLRLRGPRRYAVLDLLPKMIHFTNIYIT